MEASPLKNLTHYLHQLIEKKLWAKVLLAMVLGVVVGVLIGPAVGWVSSDHTETVGQWLALPGTLFLKLVQMIMIPLIFASIVGGITSSTQQQVGKLGMGVLLYYLTTTAIAIVLGLAVVYLLHPGTYLEATEPIASSLPVTNEFGLKSLPNQLVNILPENPLASMVTGEMLSIVIFTVIVGLAINTLAPTTAEPVIKLLNSVQEVCMTIVKWAMRLVPYAVFGLMAQLCSTIGVASIMGIGMYVLTVIAGLFALLLVYLVIIRLLVRSHPGRFMMQIKEVQLLAFSTTSSAAVMPLSLKTAEEKLNVKPEVSRFLVPIGTIINMDGTAMYQCISTVFIAQVYGIELSMANLLFIILTIVVASIGTPAIPGGGFIVLASVLQGVGIPTEGIVLIIGVERILGMFRTAVNVTGDLTACMVFNKRGTVIKTDKRQ